MAYGLVQAKTALHPWRLVFIVESVVSRTGSLLHCPLLIYTAHFPLRDPASHLHSHRTRTLHLPLQARKRDRRGATRPRHRLFLQPRLQLARASRRLQGPLDMDDRAHPLLRWSRFQLVSAWLRWLSRAHTCSLGVFLTAIIRDMGYTSINAQGLGAPAWMAAYVVAVTCGFLSDRWSIRGWFIAGGQLIGAVGYLIIAFAGPIGVRYFAVYITVCGVYMAQPLM